MSKSLSPKLTSKKLTAVTLRAAALRHLERYSCSIEDLRRVLERKVARLARRDGEDAVPAESAAWIEATLKGFCETGLLNDERYAEGRVAALARRGLPLQRMKYDLATHGVPPDAVESVLARHAEDSRDEGREPDHEAAETYARRRRLGPYRMPEARADYRQRDLAALARAGFSFDVALAVVDREAT